MQQQQQMLVWRVGVAPRPMSTRAFAGDLPPRDALWEGRFVWTARGRTWSRAVCRIDGAPWHWRFDRRFAVVEVLPVVRPSSSNNAMGGMSGGVSDGLSIAEDSAMDALVAELLS